MEIQEVEKIVEIATPPHHGFNDNEDDDDDDDDGPPPGFQTILSVPQQPLLPNPNSPQQLEPQTLPKPKPEPETTETHKLTLTPTQTPKETHSLTPLVTPTTTTTTEKQKERVSSLSESHCLGRPKCDEEIAQMVCGSCRRLLRYPPGARKVLCSCCQTINLVLQAHQVGQVKCGSCTVLLMYPYGASQVRCSSCQNVTEIGALNHRPPWSVHQGQSIPCPTPQ